MAQANQSTSNWGSVAVVAVCALVTVVAADFALARLSPVPTAIMEVDDGIRMLRDHDPDTLILGSSHTRSFLPMRDLIRERTSGDNEVVLVPVEWGLFTSYKWVLDNRVAPLVDEVRNGQKVRPSIKRALIITTFYDACDVQHIGNVNLPARAWEAQHFGDDLAHKGLTEFNRNYLQTRWKSAFSGSVLIQNRGHERVGDALREVVRPVSDERKAEVRAENVKWAKRNMEKQWDICWHPPEIAALEQILDFFLTRDIEPTIILFPLLPDITSEKSKATTLLRYEKYAAELGKRRGVRVVDMTYGAPLVGADFQDDFDHLTREANPRFAAWALENHLQFLLEPPSPGGAP